VLAGHSGEFTGRKVRLRQWPFHLEGKADKVNESGTMQRKAGETGMAILDEEQQEADVPQLAVRALTQAHRRALASGQTLVMVRDGKLIRVTRDEVVVLRVLTARKKSAVRSKSVRS
jgi:hypothetical protein